MKACAFKTALCLIFACLLCCGAVACGGGDDDARGGGGAAPDDDDDLIPGDTTTQPSATTTTWGPTTTTVSATSTSTSTTRVTTTSTTITTVVTTTSTTSTTIEPCADDDVDDDADFLIEILDGGPMALDGQAAVADSGGYLHVVATRAQGIESHTQLPGGEAWYIAQVDSVGVMPDATIDWCNHVHAVYYDKLDKELRHARFHNGHWSKSTVDEQGDVGINPSVAVDALRQAHITYYDQSNGDLKYAMRTGSQWEIQSIATEGDVGLYSDIVLDETGAAHILYRNSDAGEMRYIHNEGRGDWVDERIADGGIYPELAFDSQGFMHIVHSTGVEGNYLNNTGGIWDTITFNLPVYTAPDIVLDPQNNAHVVYTGAGALRYGTNEVSYWAEANLLTVGNPEGLSHPSISLDNADFMHMTYRNENKLGHAYRGCCDWIFETVADYGSSAGHTAYVLDDLGVGHALYYEANTQKLKYGHDGQERWESELMADTPWHAGNAERWTCSIGIDGAGALHAAYYDPTTSTLAYALNDGGGWLNSQPDGQVGRGVYPSLVVDGTGFAHIAYADIGGSGVFYANSQSGNWTVNQVHATGLSTYTSLAVDPSGHAHIAYFTDRLYYATNAGGGWVNTSFDSESGCNAMTDIAVDADGAVHIAYATGNACSVNKFKYATNESGDWLVHTYMFGCGSPEYGGQSSLILDDNGYAHLAMYCADEGLFYTSNMSGSWDSVLIDERIDDQFDVGLYPSIALDGDGNVHVLYLHTDTLHRAVFPMGWLGP